MQRRPLIAGNWKMPTTLAEARELAEAVARSAATAEGRDVMIAPPFTALAEVSRALRGSTVLLAAQNVCWAEQGAFTGEISPVMLRSLGCDAAIVGHSERRHIFGESDDLINKRLKGAMALGVAPVFCIGETLAEREAGHTFEVLERQLRLGLADIVSADPARLITAYEPVWAIGTGKTATTGQAQEAHAFIRGVLTSLFEKSVADQIRILYGGSVNSENVDMLMAEPDVDGALVGGASLKPESFHLIMHFQGKNA